MMMRIIHIALMALLLIGTAQTARAAGTLPEDAASAVVLSYSRIGEDAYPDTSLRTDQFMAHLEELLRGDYHVIALPEILQAIESGQTLPTNTIAITFSGAHKSAYDNAMKPLIERHVPFTVFYASDQADADIRQSLDWSDLKYLEQTGLVSFGLMPATYTRLASATDNEILGQINKARTRHRAELKTEPALFAYPFGEYSLRYKNLIQQQGFKAAFGLHSGTIHPGADMFALPRFSMTENYGSLDRFQLVASALPLPVTDVEPQDPHLSKNAPAIGFTVSKDLSGKLSALSCFVSGQSQPQTEILGENRVEIRLADTLGDERVRVNCTIPEKDALGQEHWRWLGMLLVNRQVEPTTQEPEELEPAIGETDLLEEETVSEEP